MGIMPEGESTVRDQVDELRSKITGDLTGSDSATARLGRKAGKTLGSAVSYVRENQDGMKGFARGHIVSLVLAAAAGYWVGRLIRNI